MADWDSDSRRLTETLQRLVRSIRNDVRRRGAFSLDGARTWRAAIMDGLTTPNLDYVGRFRGEKGLERVGVRIGDYEGPPPAKVAERLAEFDRIRHAPSNISTVCRRLEQRPTPRALMRSSTCADGRTRKGIGFIRLRTVTDGQPGFERMRSR